ncbi:MAG TPA: DUF6263 family protein [Gemmataceae bacterium]|nr:DUF6263 family protein [Gemmataceae bacterium]
MRFKFKAGEKVRYTTESRTLIEMTLGGETVKQETTLAIDMTWEATQVDKDGRATVTSTLDRGRFSTDTAGGKMSYDTKEGKEPDDELFKLMVKPLRTLVGGQVTFEMTPRGLVEKVKPSEEVEKLYKGRNFMVVGIVQTLAAPPLVLPVEAPRKSDSWTEKAGTATTPATGPAALEVKYTYEGPVQRGGRQVEKISMKLVASAEKPPQGTKVDL